MMAWTVKNEGVTALLKGLGPRLWFSVPGSAITFAGKKNIYIFYNEMFALHLTFYFFVFFLSFFKDENG